MTGKRNLLIITAALTLCLTVTWFTTSIHGTETTHDPHPHLAVSQNHTDTEHMVDAYEKLMERYIDITENQVSDLSKRLAAIERNLGINPDIGEKSKDKKDK
jgi:hypothetical protein